MDDGDESDRGSGEVWMVVVTLLSICKPVTRMARNGADIGAGGS